jgi:hypothetical protein
MPRKAWAKTRTARSAIALPHDGQLTDPPGIINSLDAVPRASRSHQSARVWRALCRSTTTRPRPTSGTESQRSACNLARHSACNLARQWALRDAHSWRSQLTPRVRCLSSREPRGRPVRSAHAGPETTPLSRRSRAVWAATRICPLTVTKKARQPSQTVRGFPVSALLVPAEYGRVRSCPAP